MDQDITLITTLLSAAKVVGWPVVIAAGTIYGARQYVFPWVRTSLGRKWAREAVRYAFGEVDDIRTTNRRALELLALKHFKSVATGPVKKWSDEDILGSIRDVWAEVESQTLAIARDMRDTLTAAARTAEKASAELEIGLRRIDAINAARRPDSEDISTPPRGMPPIPPREDSTP